MPKRTQTKPKSDPIAEEDLPYTSLMRVYGGVAWATILTFVVAAMLVVIPQVPRPWLSGVPVIWVGLAILGIALQWSIARGTCPKCGFRLTVTKMGKRCPKCRSYLKAVDRKIVRF